MQADRELCAAAGMNDFVLKPIEPAQLWQVLARWIRPRAGLPQAPAQAQATDPSAPAAAPAAMLPSVIEGLDMVQGLRRVMGRQTLYLELLGKFARSQAKVPAQVRAALTDGDLALARRLVHTLRGLAGNLGAGEERAIVDGGGAAALAPALEVLAAQLEPLVGAIRALLPDMVSAPAPAAAPVDIAVVGEQLQRLLDQGDGDAADYFAAHRASLQVALGPACAEIASAIDDFDFDVAARVLAQARSREAAGQ
jgi:two-component system sensor histidine kinase/response regulator